MIEDLPAQGHPKESKNLREFGLNGGRKKTVFGGPRVKEARKVLRKVKTTSLKVILVPIIKKRVQIMNITRTKAEAKIKKEKEKKVPGTWSRCNDKEVKKDMAIPENQTIGIPVYLMIPQLQPQEEPLHGMARDTLHGWQQSHCILPTIRHTLFWILAAHGHLDRQRQSGGSRNKLCITALRQTLTWHKVLRVCQLRDGELLGKLYHPLSDKTSMFYWSRRA